jgi:hypothetical protein
MKQLPRFSISRPPSNNKGDWLAPVSFIISYLLSLPAVGIDKVLNRSSQPSFSALHHINVMTVISGWQ